MAPVLISLVLLIIVGGAITLGVRLLGKHTDEEGGLDLIPYGLLAIAVGVTVFSLAELARAAFPATTLVEIDRVRVATALAGLVVGTPIAALLWRRQDQRRRTHPQSAGWPVYLAIAEAIYTTALVVAGYQLLVWLFGDATRPSWTDVVVFGAAAGFHEWAARRDRPGSDIAELPRVVGSAIGLIAGSIGVAGLLYSLFHAIYGTITPTAGTTGIGSYFALTLLGAPLWAYRWLQRWPASTGIARKTWLVLTGTTSLSTAIGSLVAMVISVMMFVFGDHRPAGEHFEFLPTSLAIVIVAVAIWAHHRARIRTEGRVSAEAEGGAETDIRDNTLRSYEYIMTALGLAFAVGSATALVTEAFGDVSIVDSGDASGPLSIVVVLLAALMVWWWFWSRCQHADRAAESVAVPRRVYLLGMAVISGLAGAQALIATLVVLFQAALGESPNTGALATQSALFVFGGGATWHLMRTNRADKALAVKPEVILPFDLTVICSHPGPLATVLPKQARLRILYRGDQVGVVDTTMAEEIATAVNGRSSMVWVGEEGFLIAPTRSG